MCHPEQSSTDSERPFLTVQNVTEMHRVLDWARVCVDTVTELYDVFICEFITIKGFILKITTK